MAAVLQPCVRPTRSPRTLVGSSAPVCLDGAKPGGLGCHGGSSFALRVWKERCVRGEIANPWTLLLGNSCSCSSNDGLHRKQPGASASEHFHFRVGACRASTRRLRQAGAGRYRAGRGGRDEAYARALPGVLGVSAALARDDFGYPCDTWVFA